MQTAAVHSLALKRAQTQPRHLFTLRQLSQGQGKGYLKHIAAIYERW